MKVAVLGGGITGLTASYCLAKKGHAVTLFEKESVLGGLAAGFKDTDWDWPLEKHYHHLFTNDADFLDFADEIGFDGIFFQAPATASLYPSGPIPLNSAGDLFRFPILTLPEKLRAAAVIAFLKLSPFLKLYEKQTAEIFLKKTMGERPWVALWRPLFRKKFGKYAENILTSFIWSRIKKRTPALGYMTGGFGSFVNYLEIANQKLEVIIKKNHPVETIIKKESGLAVNQENFDAVVSTLPTPILIKISGQLLPVFYLKSLSLIKYLHAVNLIVASRSPIVKKYYWLNIMVREFPFVALVQHTNFIDKKYYGGHHLLYIGNYLEKDHPLFQMTKEETLAYFFPYLQKLKPNIKELILKTYLFHGPFAQPIFDKSFLKNKPDFETPVKNFFIANLDMTYPHDRGTNYAVKLGREIADLI